MIISEVTPRQIRRDEEVQICNKTLHNQLGESVTLANHSNLRNSEWSFHVPGDDKHLAAESIARFAHNLKSAFRKAIGFDRKPRKEQNIRRDGSTLNKDNNRNTNFHAGNDRSTNNHHNNRNRNYMNNYLYILNNSEKNIFTHHPFADEPKKNDKLTE